MSKTLTVYLADLSDVVAERDHGVGALDNAYCRVGGRLSDALDLGLEVLHRLHEFVGGTWTGSAMYVESVDTTFDATGVATCSASLTGVVAFA